MRKGFRNVNVLKIFTRRNSECTLNVTIYIPINQVVLFLNAYHYTYTK